MARMDRTIIGIFGRINAGKSTCMNILGCLDTPTAGSYRFRGIEVGGLSRSQRALLRRNYLGFVFQGYNLLNRTTALENVELPLIYRGLSPAKRRPLVEQAIEDRGGSRHVTDQLAPVLDRTIAGHHRATHLITTHDDLEEKLTALLR